MYNKQIYYNVYTLFVNTLFYFTLGEIPVPTGKPHAQEMRTASEAQAVEAHITHGSHDSPGKRPGKLRQNGFIQPMNDGHIWKIYGKYMEI